MTNVPNGMNPLTTTQVLPVIKRETIKPETTKQAPKRLTAKQLRERRTRIFR